MSSSRESSPDSNIYCPTYPTKPNPTKLSLNLFSSVLLYRSQDFEEIKAESHFDCLSSAFAAASSETLYSLSIAAINDGLESKFGQVHSKHFLPKLCFRIYFPLAEEEKFEVLLTGRGWHKEDFKALTSQLKEHESLLRLKRSSFTAIETTFAMSSTTPPLQSQDIVQGMEILEEEIGREHRPLSYFIPIPTEHDLA